MWQYKYHWCGVLLAAMIMGQVQAQSILSPQVMLKETARKVIDALEKNKASLKTKPKTVHNIVTRLLLPHVDITGMSRSVLGRGAWKKASASQRKRFSNEFTDVVIKSYSGALADYTNEEIKFFPIREDYTRKKRVQVHSTITRQQGPVIRLSYRVIYTRGEWKIYDMIIEKVSLLKSFRSQYAGELNKGSLDDLIKKLVINNQ